MIEKLEELFNKYSDRVFYKVNSESITYSLLWKKACLYADYLRRQGSRPVIIYGDKEIEMVISIISCILAKRAYVPIGSCTPLNRIKKIIEITNSTLVISNNKLDIDIECCVLEDLYKYKDYELNNINNDIIYIIFTSGSTGEPKGVPISEDNLLNFIEWISSFYPLSSYKNINVLDQASFSFDLSVADFYYALFNGHTLIAYLNNSCDNNLYNVHFDKNIDYAVVTPTFIKLCLLNEDFNPNNYPNLRCIYFCGEQLTVSLVSKLWDRFPDLIIINAYGPTEATSAVSAIVIEREMLDDKLLPVGKVDNFATDIEIVNGQIVLKEKSVFSGYLSNIVGGYYKEGSVNCYKTGDLGYIRNGMLYCSGRVDNQIKYKGYRIELGDIENHINKIDGVNDSCVIAKKDDNGDVKTLKAFVDTNDSKLDSENIKNFLRNTIPNYMIPKTIIFQKLPVNNNGKVDRKALMDL